MIRIVVFLFIFSTFVFFNFEALSKIKHQAPSPDSLAEKYTEKYTEKQSMKLIYEPLSHIMSQAHSIFRESWWVVNQKRLRPYLSIFGKAHRAFTIAQQIKIKDKIFSCESYRFATYDNNNSGKVFESCTKENILLLEWSKTNPTRFHFTFYSEHLGDVLGLGTAILNRPIHCEIETQKNNQVVLLSCPNLYQDKAVTEIYHFEQYEYKKSDQNMIVIKGYLMVNFSKSKQIDVKIPLEGKIQVIETQLESPRGQEALPAPPLPPQPVVPPETTSHSENKQLISH